MNNSNADFNTSQFPTPRKVLQDGAQEYRINSYSLFQWLGRTNYPAWCKHEILTVGQEGVDFSFITSGYKNQKGRPRNEYLLTIDFAKHIALSSKSEAGRKYRQYLIKFEDSHRNKIVKLSQTPEAAKFFTSFLESLKEYSPTAHLTMGAKISKEVFGIEIPHYLLPEITEDRLSATEIAEKYGSTKNMVGRIATQLGLKKPPFATQRLSMAKDVNKEVTMYFYNQEAVELIRQKLGLGRFDNTLF